VVVCEDCGFSFADNIPGQEAFDAYYRDLSKYEYQHRDGRESANDESRLRDAAQTLSEVIPDKSTRILEIGCSTGRLLGLLKERGYQNVWGLDPSPVCAASARDLYGVTVRTESVSDPGEDGGEVRLPDSDRRAGAHRRPGRRNRDDAQDSLAERGGSTSTCPMRRSSRIGRMRPTSSSAWSTSTSFPVLRWRT